MKKQSLALAFLSTFALVGLSACGSDSSTESLLPDSSATAQSSSPEQTNSPAATSLSATPSPSNNEPKGDVIYVPMHNTPSTGWSDKGVGFIQSPTGNIACEFYPDGQAGCGVESYLENREYPNHGFYNWWFNLSADPIEFTTRQDAPNYKNHPEDIQTVEYGEIVKYYDYVCESEEKGMTCFNSKNQNHVFMSRDDYDIATF